MAQDETISTEGPALDAAGATSAPEDGAKKSHLPDIPVAELAQIANQDDLLRVLQLHEQWTRAVLDPNVDVASGRANLKGADLRGYDLSGVNLSGANLSGANLAGCDLEGANLTVANLERAILATCNLRHAKLRRARLDHADLRGADLTGAVLTGVDLSKAILKTPEEIASAKEAAERARVAPTEHGSGAASAPTAEPFQQVAQTLPDLGQAPAIATPELPPGVIL